MDRDTAVVVGTDSARGTDKGEAYRIVYRYTITCIWRDGRWHALAEPIRDFPPALTSRRSLRDPFLPSATDRFAASESEGHPGGGGVFDP